MKVTRIIRTNKVKEFESFFKVAGYVRADIWRRYGGIKNIGKSNQDVRAEICKNKLYDSLPIDGTIRNETTKDIINDILLYKASAKEKVRKAIKIKDVSTECKKELNKKLSQEQWLQDNFLHRQMRKHFKHGRSEVNNQFIIRSDRHTETIENGLLVISVQIHKKYGGIVKLITNTNGKNVNLKNRNLRIIDKEKYYEIHYSFDKPEGRICGDKEIGIDKGYSEAFTDSDGEHHGIGFGKVLTAYSDKVSKTGKGRNKLHVLEKKHRKNGNNKKADNILKFNLGRIKLNKRREETKSRLRDIAYKAANSIVDKANVVGVEDLTNRIPKKHPWKKFNRRMANWAKSVLAEAIASVTEQRNATQVVVNAAYTSQMDSQTKRLEGRRVGDKFYCVSGDVLQADHNAAVNVKDRIYDKQISLYMPYQKVREILLSRSPSQLSDKRLEFGESLNQVRNNPMGNFV